MKGTGLFKLFYVAPGMLLKIVARLNLSNCSLIVILVREFSYSGDFITLRLLLLLCGLRNLNYLVGVLDRCG